MTFRSCLSLPFLMVAVSLPSPCEAWVGYEISTEAAVASNPYAPAGERDSGSGWTLDGRFMVQESAGTASFEAHALLRIRRATGLLAIGVSPAESVFRVWDLEFEPWKDGDRSMDAQIDRLTASVQRGGGRLTVGRQAVTWGEACYFNVGDVFGAFPLLETNRLHKPGIDAVSARVSLGPFSSLEAVAVPETGQGDSLAARLTAPLAGASLSLTFGQAAGDEEAGAGISADVKGTKAYASWARTREGGGQAVTQAVLGAERQLGDRTHMMGEIYRNGWGTSDASEYPALLAKGLPASGHGFSIGRHMAVLSVDRQLTPLLAGAASVFANLSDGSALVRFTGNRSLSDLADLAFGASFGVGERPRGSGVRSEYGSAPVTLFAEAVATY